MFLTRAELVELTGYKRPSAMARKLREYGLRFFVARDGYPRVPRSEIEQRRERAPATEPDFSGLGH